jgi:hypothetical protein
METDDCKLRGLEVQRWTADRNGRVCAQELLETDRGGALEVTAPERSGGGCAGRKHWAFPKGVPGGSGAQPIVVRLDMSPLATGELKGRIVSADRRPIRDATIQIVSIVVSDTCSFFGHRAPVKSAADGRFSFAAVARGTARLHVKHPRFVVQEVKAIVPSSDVEIVLDEGATWQGRVFDPDGAPLADCRVVATAAPDFVATSPCIEGSFSLGRLPAGDVEVAVGTEERSLLGVRAWKTKARMVAGEHRQQDLSWPTGVTVAGTILDEAGAPIADARLSALPRGERQPPSSLHPEQVLLRADGNGRFTFRHLAPGRWVIKGDLRAAHKGSIEVDATTDQTKVRLVVPKAKGN